MVLIWKCTVCGAFGVGEREDCPRCGGDGLPEDGKPDEVAATDSAETASDATAPDDGESGNAADNGAGQQTDP